MHSEEPGHKEKNWVNQTDAELFLALKAGQIAALGILYDRHAGLIYGLALKILGNAQEAEDLTQEIFLALSRGSAYDPKRGSLRTFLAVMTRSRAIDKMRSRNTASRFLGRWKSNTQESTSNSPFEYVAQNEQAQEVQAALAQLSDNQQQVLKLAYYDGLSQSEIAQRLDIPLGTVKGRSRQGLLKLRQSLTDFIQ
jgi:RNA polymerase sigma-70 factor, ECF subfamily